MGILDPASPALSKNGRERLLSQNATALQKCRAGLAGREYEPFDVVFVGDSISEGQGATTFARTYRQQTIKRLRERFPVAGVVGGRGFIGAVKTGFTSGTWPVTSSGAIGIDVAYGPKRQTAILSASGHSLTFSLQGTSVDIMYGKATTTGTFSYTIDGGAPATFSTTTGTGVVDGGQMTRVTLGASGAHTLVISYDSGGPCYIEGVVEYDGDETKGIRGHDAGHHGWTSAQWANRNGFNYWMASIKNLQPDLLVFALGTNDVTAGTITAAQQLANFQSIIGYIRGTGCNPSILLTPMFQRSETTPPVWAEYVQNAYTLAAGDPLMAVMDYNARMPAAGLGLASLGLYADTVHPTDKGHSMMADFIVGAIAPQ